MLLTKGEKAIGLVDAGYARIIVNHLSELFGEPEVRKAMNSGYVRKAHEYLAYYNGRFGVGLTVRTHTNISTRYCPKYTYIWDCTIEEVEEAVEEIKGRYGLR